jgi:adenine-specific DNA-methyltransferase
LNFRKDETILNKLSKDKIFLDSKELAQGIVFPQDSLNRKNSEKLGDIYPVGSGIFVLTESEKRHLKLSAKELKLIKPYYTTDQISRYYASSENTLWAVYTDSNFKNPRSMDKYPNLKQHLDKYKKVITSDNKPYGLHRARDERFFIGEKIIVQRKCVGQPVFSYSDFDCYVSATFYVIKTDRINLKCLLGILNSRLMAYWLKNKGKMQGENYQLDKEPLQGMPLPKIISPETSKEIEKLVNKILTAKSKNVNADTSTFEQQIDSIVYRLYNLTEDEIRVVERLR